MTSTTHIKLFYGVPLPDAQAQFLRKICLSKQPRLKDRARWTRLGNYHLTLRFIGNVEKNKLPFFIQPVAVRLNSYHSFNLPVKVIAPFPSSRSKLIAAQCSPTVDAVNINQDISAAVESVGVAPEQRSLRPHVSLCRIKPNEHVQLFPINVRDVVITCREVALYESCQTDRGVEYKILYRFKLR